MVNLQPLDTTTPCFGIHVGWMDVYAEGLFFLPGECGEPSGLSSRRPPPPHLQKTSSSSPVQLCTKKLPFVVSAPGVGILDTSWFKSYSSRPVNTSTW